MNKMIARTALAAILALSALSLTACGTNNDCPRAEQSSSVTETTAMFDAKAGGGKGGGRSRTNSSNNSGNSNSGFNWFWMGSGSHSEKCQKPNP